MPPQDEQQQTRSLVVWQSVNPPDLWRPSYAASSSVRLAW